MAGIKAASVGIEMYADVARLVKDMRDVERVVRNCTGGMAGNMQVADKAVADAGLSMRQLAREAQRLKDRIDPLGPAQRAYAQDLRNAKAAQKAGLEVSGAKIDPQGGILLTFGKSVDPAERAVELK